MLIWDNAEKVSKDMKIYVAQVRKALVKPENRNFNFSSERIMFMNTFEESQIFSN